MSESPSLPRMTKRIRLTTKRGGRAARRPAYRAGRRLPCLPPANRLWARAAPIAPARAIRRSRRKAPARRPGWRRRRPGRNRYAHGREQAEQAVHLVLVLRYRKRVRDAAMGSAAVGNRPRPPSREAPANGARRFVAVADQHPVETLAAQPRTQR